MTDTIETLFRLDEAMAYVTDATQLSPQSVRGAVELLDDGNSIPFIARYRKERTGAVDEAGLRAIEDALTYYRDLCTRKETVLKTIDEQGLLSDGLKAQILATRDRQELEELYLPYKPKRRTRATIARERGLAPLAEILASQENPAESRDEILAPFIRPDADVPDAEAALAGACDIVAEGWAEDRETRAFVREQARRGEVTAKVRRAHKGKPSKFEQYYDYREPLSRIPSHRFLAIRRGEAEGVLTLGLAVENEEVVERLRGRLLRNSHFMFRAELSNAIDDSYRRLLFPAAETELLADLKEIADEEAIEVFSQNLRELLLAAPAGTRSVLGIDPGFRTGCKVVVVDGTGKFLENATIFPTPPRNNTTEAKATLLRLIDRHQVDLVAIGNGTASRETSAFVNGVLKECERQVAKIVVSEAGASIYSASDLAREEFPDLDLTVRGAISIARRLQDPLAELVKIDPKSIGVGQYQHDVNQSKLRKALDREVESCVNRVGVDLNTASAQLLSYVAGIGGKLGESIVRYRDENGEFSSRKQLLKVPRLGARAFEQCAGFLRVRGGREPLDGSAVHPESYYVVERMADNAGVPAATLVGDAQALRSLQAADYVDERFGLPTIEDILSELEKPGRDPRKEFVVPDFRDEITEVSDLKEDMILEGVVTNVTRFGAFVDVGVHEDGLVHISELDRKYVRDPTEVVAVGDIIKVKVLSVDVERKRIALSRKQTL